MLLILSTTHRPATDLGYLLHKHPERTQAFDLTFGRAHVFYPEASEDRCTAALLLEVDPVQLVRGRRAGEGPPLAQYVNDRPYVASSFLSVAIAEVFGSALAGRSKDRPELAQTPVPLEARLSVVPSRGGEGLLRRLFEPLGYTVAADRLPLDETLPAWGMSPYYALTLAASCRLADLLTHLYVLVPVLDDEKHYWVGDAEVEKLLRHGEGWLAAHPERELITRRYLKHRLSLVRDAIARLARAEGPDSDVDSSAPAGEEAALEERLSLNQQRLGAVLAALRASGARRVLDLGCGEGNLLRELLQDRRFTEIVGLDVSYRTLERARQRLRLDRPPETGAQAFQSASAPPDGSPAPRPATDRLRLLHGALTYRDRRLEGFDAAAVVEVVEHLDPSRLAAFERVLFEYARPGSVVLTTPNREYNFRWESLPAGRFRHRDHRFEWTRAEFRAWAEAVGLRLSYTVRFLAVGPDDPEVGPPTQMGLFTRK